eukprot:3136856-Pleurochrysis_carterae.AAC.3
MAMLLCAVNSHSTRRDLAGHLRSRFNDCLRRVRAALQPHAALLHAGQLEVPLATQKLELRLATVYTRRLKTAKRASGRRRRLRRRGAWELQTIWGGTENAKRCNMVRRPSEIGYSSLH